MRGKHGRRRLVSPDGATFNHSGYAGAGGDHLGIGASAKDAAGVFC
jgi:hypothetical protein